MRSYDVVYTCHNDVELAHIFYDNAILLLVSMIANLTSNRLKLIVIVQRFITKAH